MMSWIGGGIVIVLFVLLFKLFRLADISSKAIELAKTSVVIVRDSSLSDLEKEKQVQQYALGLFKSFFQITVAGISAVLLPISVIWALDFLGVISLNNVLTTMLSWPFLLGSTLVGCLAIWLRRKQ